MSRYIDADKLMLDIRLDKRPTFRGAKIPPSVKETMFAYLDSAPHINLDDYVPKDFHDKTCEAMAKAHQEEIADMVSVVRCKECKWYDNGQNESDSWNYCTRHFGHYIDVNDDDYCSYGEREGE